MLSVVQVNKSNVGMYMEGIRYCFKQAYMHLIGPSNASLEFLRVEVDFALANDLSDAHFAKVYLESDDDAFFVVVSDGQVIGTRGAHIIGRECKFVRLSVLPIFKRRGVAKLLCERAELFAKSHHCTMMFLIVWGSNVVSLNFHQAMGFVVKKTSDSCGEIYLTMKKRVTHKRRK